MDKNTDFRDGQRLISKFGKNPDQILLIERFLDDGEYWWSYQLNNSQTVGSTTEEELRSDWITAS